MMMKKIGLLLLLTMSFLYASAQTIPFVVNVTTPNGWDFYGNYPVLVTGIRGFTYSDTIYTDVWGSFEGTIMGNSSQAGIKTSLIDCNGNLQIDSAFANRSKSQNSMNLYECLQQPQRLHADFSYTINGFTPNGFSVTFFDQSIPAGQYWPIIEWDWDTGEQSPNTGKDSVKVLVYPDSSTYTHEYRYPGIYEIWLYAHDNIYETDDEFMDVDFMPSLPSSICGLWEYGDRYDSVDNAILYLITHDSVAGTLTAIDTTYSVSTGYFGFTGLADGNYYLKAAPLPSDPDFATKMPTYYVLGLEVTRWQDASPINVTSTAHARKDFDFVQGNNPGGPGFIGGLISQGAGKTGPGDPLENVSILIYDMQDNPITHTLTDANGEYNFPNLAYGTYKVHVEVIGKTSTDQIVTISAGEPMVTEIDFEVNSKTVDLPTALEEVTFGKILNLYPNPTSGDLYVEMNLAVPTDISIVIIDPLGRNLKAENHRFGSGNQEFQMDFDDISTGIYFIRLTAEGQTLTRRVVKW